MDNHTRVEQIKRRIADFGGIQFDVLGESELRERLCAARYCGNIGFAQIASAESPDKGTEFYRIVCKLHLVRTIVAQSTVLGDPSPTSDARALAAAIDLDWVFFLRAMPYADPISPQEFRCILCGGNLMAETAGMKRGRRWVHTCEPE